MNNGLNDPVPLDRNTSQAHSVVNPDSPTLRNIHLKLTDDRARVAIVDGDELFMEGISSILELWPEFEIIGTCTNYADAVRLCAQFKPALVIMSVHIEKEMCTTAVRSIIQESPNTHIMLTASSHETNEVLDAIRAGARGYCARNEASANRMRALSWGVACGDMCFSGSLGEGLQHALLNPRATNSEQDEKHFESLTDREREILVLLANGMSNKEIAHELYLSEPTVKKSISQIVRKLRVKNRTHAAVAASLYASREPSGSSE